MPESLRKRQALAVARGERPHPTATGLELLDQLGVEHPVRHAVDLLGHHGLGDGLAQVVVLHRLRHRGVGGEQEAGAHGDAVGAVRERGDQAATVEEAAGGDDGDAALDRVDHLRQEDGRGHRAGVAAALAALHEHRVDAPLEHLLGVALGADRRARRARRRRAAARSAPPSAPGRSSPPSPARRSAAGSRSPMSAASARRFTPNGLVVRCFTSRDGASAAGRSPWWRWRGCPSPPAVAVAAVRRAPDTQPMPVCTIGYSTPTRSQKRVCRRGCISRALPGCAARGGRGRADHVAAPPPSAHASRARRRRWRARSRWPRPRRRR